MNYYPFHLGDYAAHTGHLEPMEDIAYRRLLDLYYMHEKALPADVKKAARLVRMVDSLEVIQSVLEEFFVLSDDGWHNKRADEELTSMHAKQEQQSTKDAHEADRMKRFRERRAEMFAALRKVGIVPAWDVAMKELQRLFDSNCNGHATDLQRVQDVDGNADATAIPIPTPTPTPTPTPEEKKGETRSRAPIASRPDGVGEQVWDDWLALRKQKKAPVTETVLREAQTESKKAGMSLERFLTVWCARGSQGLQADWLNAGERSAQGTASGGSHRQWDGAR